MAIVLEANGQVPSLKNEGIRTIERLTTKRHIEDCIIHRTPLLVNRLDESGPFDIIGDVHGCCDELGELLDQLGYTSEQTSSNVVGGPIYTHPENRKAVFVGDLVDRGPRSLDVVNLVYNMVQRGSGLCVMGNHDNKFLNKLQGKNVNVSSDLSTTMEEFDRIDRGCVARNMYKQFVYF